MPKTYTVEIHRTVTVTPKRSSEWGWGIFIALLLVGGIYSVGSHHAKQPDAPEKFHNPFDDLAPDDNAPEKFRNPLDLAPDDDSPEAKPAQPVPIKNRTRQLFIPGDSDGQCHVEGQATAVKTASVRYLIDTGAWTVAFSRRHAKAMGLDPGTLVYDQKITTAAGPSKAANIRLRELRVGELRFTDVAAQVNDKGMETALLGATVLSKLQRFEYAQGNCILTMSGDARAALQRAPLSTPTR